MLDVTKEKQLDAGSDGELSGEEWGADWELVEMPAAPGGNFPLQAGEYRGDMPSALCQPLVFSTPVAMVTAANLKRQWGQPGWTYTRPDGTEFLEAKHTESPDQGDAKVVFYVAGKEQPFATVLRNKECSSFLVRDGNYDPYCTVERGDTMFGWEMKVRPWQGNQHRKKGGRAKPMYLVEKKPKSFTVVKKEGENKVEVARMVYGVPAKEHLAQGVAHSFVVQPGEDVGLMLVVTTATALAWHKGIPPNQTGTWADGVYTKGPPSDPGWLDLATSMVWGMAGPVARVL